jgi:hypothetical protein
MKKESTAKIHCKQRKLRLQEQNLIYISKLVLCALWKNGRIRVR